MRKNLIAGNWKMYKTPKESVEFVKQLKDAVKVYNDREILVCPAFTSLFPVSEILKDTSVKFGAQNVYFEDEGAFTGEVSVKMLQDIGVNLLYATSERRNIFMETDADINKKIMKTIAAGIVAILCVGEKLEEREQGKTFDVIERQITKCLDNIEDIKNIVIAYEPVWAIGTGKNATQEQAKDVHRFIRGLMKIIRKESAENIQYFMRKC